MDAPPPVNPKLSQAAGAPHLSVSELAQGIQEGNRTALGRAITLLESARPTDLALAQELLAQLPAPPSQTLRIAITGAPGVGKSTLIERFGQKLLEEGRRVAVLTTDPSSVRTGGSILGDKTRMPVLANHEQAFVRPSPSGRSTGGVGIATWQAIGLCEAAGFDHTLIETVGVGQSEVAARDLADVVLLLVLAQAGDELQAIKRGIIETADIIVVAKADGPATMPSKVARKLYQQALGLYPPGPLGLQTQVITCSAITGDGVPELWTAISERWSATLASGHFAQTRSAQLRAQVMRAAIQALEADFLAHPRVADKLQKLEEELAAGVRTVPGAAQQLLKRYKGS